MIDFSIFPKIDILFLVKSINWHFFFNKSAALILMLFLPRRGWYNKSTTFSQKNYTFYSLPKNHHFSFKPPESGAKNSSQFQLVIHFFFIYIHLMYTLLLYYIFTWVCAAGRRTYILLIRFLSKKCLPNRKIDLYSCKFSHPNTHNNCTHTHYT